MSQPQLYQQYVVKVNDGSGVLIQPMAPSYAYVLTAKHCVQESNDPESDIRQTHEIFSFEGAQIAVLDIVYCQTEDIAILIVEPHLTLSMSINNESLRVSEQSKYRLCGFPFDRRVEDETYSSLLLEYHEEVGGRLLFSPDEAVNVGNIIGFSGGGIFALNEHNDEVLLCAIETKMDGNIVREFHGRVSAIPISSYEKLVNDSRYQGQPLAPLLPLHLSSFEHLIEFCFDVVRSWIDDESLHFVQNCLRVVATERVIEVNLAPHQIFAEYHQLLKVHGRAAQELKSRELWTSLLELLIISILIDKPTEVNLAYVGTVLQSRRLMYIGADGGWMEYLKDILLSELQDLNDQSIIVVRTHSSPRQSLFSREYLKKAWKKKHIGRAASDPRSIINVNTRMKKIHSLVDLAALHAECIEIKEDEYDDYIDSDSFDEEQLEALQSKIAQVYGSYLTVEEGANEN